MGSLRYVQIALDDADSHYGGCTTYVTYRILRDLLREEIKPVSLPLLIRLNPYVPFKTRGNAATKFVVAVPEEKVPSLIEMVLHLVNEYSERRGKASPGVAVLVSESLDVPSELVWLYCKAVRDVVSFDLVEKICEKANVKLFGGRGRIGAAAALGAVAQDLTYELLVYGDPDAKSKLNLDFDYVKLVDILTNPLTFTNIDVDDRKILLTPAGPDPVLLGIRGDSPLHVMLFLLALLPHVYHLVEGWLMYRTNQATEIHIENALSPSYTYMPDRTCGLVVSTERTETRHVKARTSRGHLFAYRHLGRIASTLELCTGLVLEWWGGKRLCLEGYFTYVEGLRILSSRLVELRNPRCPKCGCRLESAGRGRLRCRKCNYMTESLDKELISTSLRQLEHLLVLPKVSEHRHLMKPLSRVGLEGLALEFPDFPPFWIL